MFAPLEPPGGGLFTRTAVAWRFLANDSSGYEKRGRQGPVHYYEPRDVSRVLAAEFTMTPLLRRYENVDIGLRALEDTAADDLLRGLSRSELWGRLGWLDVKRRYRRTTIGPFWTSITLLIYVVAVGTVGSALWHQDIYEYVPFLVSGMIAWLFVSTIVTESCTMLISGQALFRNIRFDYSVLAFALVWRNFIVLLHNFIVYFLVVVILKPSLLSLTAILALPGLVLVVVNAVWVSLLLGIICLRFRDVPQLVASIMQIAMLITPLFWPADTLTGLKRFVFVDLNPLYHVLDVIRGPLMGRVPGAISYGVLIAITIGGWWLTYAMFKRFRRRIAYWS
jgi:ABC-type polysaccharide/polyol phosphate export permease